MTAGKTFAGRVLGIALVAILALFFDGATRGLSAQTPEGTVITNTATVNFTDANGNVYSAVSGSVSVTVAFLGSLDVTSVATQSPLSPSTGNTLAYTITNNGNGTDTIQIAASASNTSVTNITGYSLDGGTTVLTLAQLNTALSTTSIASGGSVTVTVIYDVGSSQGDNTSNVQLTATSQRTGGNADSSTTAVTPPTTGGVNVTSNTATASRLPTSGETYSVTFQVANASSAAQLIDLTATLDATDAADLTIVSVNGNAGTSATGVSFTAGETKVITVVYTVANGSGTSTLTLSANGQTIGSDSDTHVVTGIAPVISVNKSVHSTKANAQAGSPALSTNPQPGDTIWYRIQVANTGTAPAIITGNNDNATPDMQVTDDLSGLPVTYVAASLDGSGSSVAWATLQKTGDLITATIASLPAGQNAFFVFGVVIN